MPTTITKREISERIAKQTGQTQVVAKDIIQRFLDEIVDELVKGNKLEFRDFGIFEVVVRRSRSGRNPRTGSQVFVPAKRVVSFKMGRRMKNQVAAVPPGADAAPAATGAVLTLVPQAAPAPSVANPGPGPGDEDQAEGSNEG